MINGDYKDPDNVSIVLYMLIMHKYGKKLSKFGIENFRVSIRGDKGPYQYMYCIYAEFDNRSIKLAGDWVLSWSFVNECSKDDQFEIIQKTHTIWGHPIWPCEKIEHRKTVNQARNDNISMKETLEILKKCYENRFENKVYQDDKNFKYIENAFYDYKEWYIKFETYDKYVVFWDLNRFEESVITQNNVLDIFL